MTGLTGTPTYSTPTANPARLLSNVTKRTHASPATHTKEEASSGESQRSADTAMAIPHRRIPRPQDVAR